MVRKITLPILALALFLPRCGDRKEPESRPEIDLRDLMIELVLDSGDANVQPLSAGDWYPIEGSQVIGHGDRYRIDMEGHLALGGGGRISVASVAGPPSGPEETDTALSGLPGGLPAEFQVERHGRTDGSWSLHLYLYEGSYDWKLEEFDRVRYPVTWSTPFGDFEAGSGPLEAGVVLGDSGRNMVVNLTRGTLAFAPREGEGLELAAGKHEFATRDDSVHHLALGEHQVRPDIRRWEGTPELQQAYAAHWLPEEKPSGPTPEEREAAWKQALRKKAVAPGGPRSQEVLGKTLARWAPEIKAIYEKHLKSNPSLQGTVSLRIVIAEDGAITEAAATSRHIDNAPLLREIEAWVSKQSFAVAKAAGEFTIGSFPVVLRPEG